MREFLQMEMQKTKTGFQSAEWRTCTCLQFECNFSAFSENIFLHFESNFWWTQFSKPVSNYKTNFWVCSTVSGTIFLPSVFAVQFSILNLMNLIWEWWGRKEPYPFYFRLINDGPKNDKNFILVFFLCLTAKLGNWHFLSCYEEFLSKNDL